MKTLLTILLLSFSVCALAQQGSLSQTVYRSKVLAADSAAAISANVTPIANGFAPFWWNSQASTPHWDFWNGSAYEHVFSLRNYWPLAGSRTLTGNTVITVPNTGSSRWLEIKSVSGNNNHGLWFTGGFGNSLPRFGTFDSSSGAYSSIQPSNGIQMISVDGDGSSVSFAVRDAEDSLSVRFDDNRTTKYGIVYYAHDPSDWVSSTLVTKGWVESQIATAGGAYMPLEGSPTLTNDLTINGNGFNYGIGFTNLSNFQINGDVISVLFHVDASADILDLGPTRFTHNIAASGDLSPSQITSNQNDYSPTAASWYRLSSDASRDITGWVAPIADGDLLEVYNVGSFDINFTHEDTDSAAANRFLINGGGTLTVSPNECVIFRYDATTQRWRLQSYTG